MTTHASFVLAYEIAKRGKPYTDEVYIKECFINTSEVLFNDLKNKDEIIKKIKDMPLSSKTIGDRIIKMTSDVSNQQVNDIRTASSFSVALDESWDVCDSG